jgi:hypothetical protein
MNAGTKRFSDENDLVEWLNINDVDIINICCDGGSYYKWVLFYKTKINDKKCL